MIYFLIIITLILILFIATMYFVYPKLNPVKEHLGIYDNDNVDFNNFLQLNKKTASQPSSTYSNPTSNSSSSTSDEHSAGSSEYRITDENSPIN